VPTLPCETASPLSGGGYGRATRPAHPAIFSMNNERRHPRIAPSADHKTDRKCARTPGDRHAATPKPQRGRRCSYLGSLRRAITNHLHSEQKSDKDDGDKKIALTCHRIDDQAVTNPVCSAIEHR